MLLQNVFILQNTPFSRITYSIIGDDGATSMFTLNTNTGGISNLPALYSDNGRTYQVRGDKKLSYLSWLLECFEETVF